MATDKNWSDLVTKEELMILLQKEEEENERLKAEKQIVSYEQSNSDEKQGEKKSNT